MKIARKIASFIIITAFICLILGSCAKEGAAEPRPLFDEDGIYLEENFIYNCAIEKDGAHLIVNGKTDYCICYEDTTDESVFTAVNELKSYFDERCGGIDVKAGNTDGKAIRIGKYGYTPQTPLKKMGAYIVEIGASDVLIYAETVYGLTNGVYGFMEDYLGCVFFDHETTYIPPVESMILAQKTDVQEPAFESRDVGDNETWRYASFAQKLRVRQDGTFLTDGCHHSIDLIPQEILDAHPEYYAYVGGARRSGEYLLQGPQLCFSNDEVIDLLEEAIVKKANNYTGDQTVWWDISQEDSMNYCTCSKCAALSKEMGNHAAPIFRCVNIIAKRHPELKFSTLAYHYGSTPPTNIEFEDNVMVKWCIMSSYGANDFSAPMTEGASPIAVKQRKEIIGWAELVDHIYVWDYITNYFNYLLPFPCLEAMAGNIRLLRDCGVEGILSLSAYNGRGAWDRLKANYAAHLLWNPDMDETAFINRFLTAYYGKDAAAYVMETYRKMQLTVRPTLNVYDVPAWHEKDYLSKENMEEYYSLLGNAFEAAQGNETYLKRLRFERLTLLYASYKLRYGTQEELAAMKREIVELCDEFSVTAFNETGTELVDSYR
ncbi:MAG: DUF4838 domain-containing protein [Clostridia bacterium]|nr:DUF4838 domain-containing protein [Clostridia bacterium]